MFSIPVPLAQAQGHAVAKRWSGVDFPLKPPLETGEDNPLYHKYGFPKVRQWSLSLGRPGYFC